jgi:hypothetical protein
MLPKRVGQIVVLPSSAPTLDGGFGPADHTLGSEIHNRDLAHIPLFLRRAVGLSAPSGRGET